MTEPVSQYSSPDGAAGDRLQRLAAYAPALRGLADIWIETAPLRGSGTADPYVMGSGVPRLTQAALEFVQMLYDAGWILNDFDWAGWIDSDGERFWNTPATVIGASEDDLAKLLTALVRQDRFVEGTLQEAFANDVFLVAAERAQSL
ncbi:MAG: hypothetical protein J0I19_08175 [Alphaproteobacteria bacterium]|nr:hypothetical protein [Alphaproteobacteria bacterium]